MFRDVKIFVFFFLPYSVLATLHSSLFERIPIPFVADLNLSITSYLNISISKRDNTALL